MSDYIREPELIEKRSFEIIGEALGEKNIPGLRTDIIKRVIHTTADFEYGELLQFREAAEDKLLQSFMKGCTIICDTNMIKSGINKRLAKELNINVECFVDSEEAFEVSKREGITRSMASVDIAACLAGPKVFVIGNAPTALYRIMELQASGKLEPDFIVGVPVGFVGAAESKEALWSTGFPCIITKGRKGGSTIGVAIVNAVMREAKARIGKQQVCK